MPSPFPGMDPYLEDPVLWRGVHDALIVYIRDALQPLVRPRYYVEISERVYLEEPPDIVIPDASIHLRRQTSGNVATAGVLVADTPTVLVAQYEQRETFIEIRAAGSHAVVTVLELISPSNKVGRGRDEYQEKQDQIRHSEANLVEIDLLRAGSSVVAAPAAQLLTLSPFDYLACVSRSEQRKNVEVYHFTLRDRLPRIAVPLRPPDADVVLDLPGLFNRCYDNGAYADRVDYTIPPRVALSPEGDAWADRLLRSAGLRS